MRHPPAWRTARFLRRSSSGLRQAFVASLLGEFCYLIVNPLDFQGHAYVVRMLREETEQQISFRLQFLAFIPPIHGGWWHGLHLSALVPGGYKLGQLPPLMNCQLLQRAERLYPNSLFGNLVNRELTATQEKRHSPQVR